MTMEKIVKLDQVLSKHSNEKTKSHLVYSLPLKVHAKIVASF